MDGFTIENLDKFEKKLLDMAQKRFPDVIQGILESLGEVLIGEAKSVLQNDNRPHARYAKKERTIAKGKNKGRSKNYLQYRGSVSTNAIDSGTLWNSLSRGGSGNIWTFNGTSGNFSLCAGSSVKHAKFINDGYTMTTPHWVPGIIDGSGKFIHQSGASTGIFVRPRTYKGVKFFDIGFKELMDLAPAIIKSELYTFAEEFNNA